MKCEDCQSKDREPFLFEAEIVLFLEVVPQVKLICQACFDDYAYAEGEVNLTYYDLDDVEDIFKKVNEVLKYQDERYSSLLSEYTKLKKEAE